MKIETFGMERWQSEWEHVVDFNLSESGVHPMSVGDLLEGGRPDDLIGTRLAYIQTDGTRELKERIAALYPGASPGNVLVTSGSSEANFLAVWRLAEPGAEAVFMLPNFLQMLGLLRGFSVRVRTFTLREAEGWTVDLDELRSLVTGRTRLLVLTDPNNPTGAVQDEQTRRRILELARDSGAWLIVDEVYRGSELDGAVSPGYWGEYEKTVVVGGLSKAFGLPGLRIGWAVGPEDFIQDLWRCKDYTTITVSAVSDFLARLALAPEKREKILERTRGIVRGNFRVLKEWMQGFGGLFECVPPRAGAIAFPRYDLDLNSTELALRLKDSRSVLVCPGDHFGMDRHIRFGLGESAPRFEQGLARVGAGLRVFLGSP